MYKLSHSKGFGEEVKRRIMLGTLMLSGDHQEAYFKKAQQVPRLINKFTEQLLTYFDYLKLPITPMTAFTFGATKADLVAGMHAISIPKKIDDAGKQVFANVF